MTVPTLRRGGKKMITIRITRHVTRSDVQDFVAYRLSNGYDAPTSREAVLKELREGLRENTGYDEWWGEANPEAVDDAMERADEIVKKLWPDWDR